MDSPLKVIIFDAFGTLVKIGKNRSPYLKLMKWLKDNGRRPCANDAAVIMSNSVDIAQLSIIFGKSIPNQLLQELNNDLQFELNTIELYDDTVTTLKNLKELGFKIALCSNLAMPYGERLKALLPNLFDAVLLSYEIGAIKPEYQIYEAIKAQFSCQMSDMLFVGDHPFLDVEIPISLGMSARLIERNRMQSLSDVLNDLVL